MALSVTALVLAGCSQGQRKGWADAIVQSADRARRLQSMQGTFSITVTPRPPKDDSELPSRVRSVATGPLPMALEPAAGLAAVGGGAGGPSAVFIPGAMFQRRPTEPAPAAKPAGDPVALLAQAGQSPKAGQAAPGNPLVPGLATNVIGLALPTPPPPGAPGTVVSTTGAQAQRPWLAVSFRRLTAHDHVRVAGSYGVNPDDVLVLLRGVLTGSVRRIGVEEIGAAPATHYRARIGRDKAERGLGQRGTDLEKAVKAHAVSGLVNDVDVWIGVDGLPRRVQVQFDQELDSGDRGRVVVTLDQLTAPSAPLPPIAVPTREQTSRLDSFGQLVETVSSASGVKS